MVREGHSKGAALLSSLLLLQNNLKNATQREGAFLSPEFQVIVHHTDEVHSSKSLPKVALSCPNLKKAWVQLTFSIQIIQDSLPR